MQIKQEKQTINLTDKIKEIVKTIAISFFFSCFIFFLFLMIISPKLNFAIDTLNMMAVNVQIRENEDIKIDLKVKRLINYPQYGTIYATILAPSIKLNNSVYHGDDYSILNKGIGHYSGSFFPGEGGTIILASHNSKQFKNLYDIKNKDYITIKTSYGTFKYQVYDTKVIKYNDEKALEVKDDEEVLIMYTCYPRYVIGFASERFVVYSRLVEANYEE